MEGWAVWRLEGRNQAVAVGRPPPLPHHPSSAHLPPQPGPDPRSPERVTCQKSRVCLLAGGENRHPPSLLVLGPGQGPAGQLTGWQGEHGLLCCVRSPCHWTA